MLSNDRRIRFLNAMGVDTWVPRDQAAATGATAQAADATVTVNHGRETGSPVQPQADAGFSAGQIDNLDWGALEKCVAACRHCELHKARTQTVFGTGDKNASWLIVGEAPGADEDAAGEPFVGRAGQLLNAMIKAVGAEREQIYIANIVKCRPPSNRNPRADEAASCAAYLHRQIALIKPDLILAVGRVAANNLLDNENTLGSMRGQVYEFSAAKIPLIVTYHPAYLLRKPSEKAKAWQDLKLALSVALPQVS